MKTHCKLFSLLMVMLLATATFLSGCGSGSGESSGASNQQALMEQLEYDVEKAPKPVRNVVILSGTWEEMGSQYAKQFPDVVKRCVASGVSGMLQDCTYEEGLKAVREQVDYYDEHAPEVTQLFQGLAAGAGIDFETVAMGMGSFYNAGFCSTMAAWGQATKGGKLLVGANWDTEGGDSYYLPAIMAYPKDGHAFVASCGFFGNIVMNDAGVVLTGSSGQSAKEEDTGLGLPVISPMTFLAAKADDAAKAKDLYISDYSPGTGDNFHVADTSGVSYVVEHTAAKDCVRQSGDFGEKDYTIATNDFMMEEMQDSLYSGEEFWDDNRPRYWTEERILLDGYGKATPDTIAKALSCNGFYIPKDWKKSGWKPMFPEEELKTGWNDDVWNLNRYQGYWSPENREPSLKAVTKSVADPKNQTLYIMNGSADTLVSGNPEATGNFMNLKLCETYEEAVYEAQRFALMQNWLAARDIDNAKGDTKEREENLDKSKAATITGENYVYRANLAGEKADRMKYYGKALSKYCEAQCYAQLAQDNPTCIAREGANY